MCVLLRCHIFIHPSWKASSAHWKQMGLSWLQQPCRAVGLLDRHSLVPMLVKVWSESTLHHFPFCWTVQTFGQYEYNVCTWMHVDIAYGVWPLNDHSLVSIPTVAQRLCCHVNHGWLDDNLEVVVSGSWPHSYFTVNSAWVQAGKWYITTASVYSTNNQPVKNTPPSLLLCARSILQGAGLQIGLLLQHVDMVYWTENSGMLKLGVWFTLAPGWLHWYIIGKQR